MAKIDCSVTVNFLMEWRRMCLAEHAKCKDECPFGICENGEGLGCDVFVQKLPMTAVEVVQRWSDEHPQKTRFDDLKEKYPRCLLNTGDEYPTIRPMTLGYCEGCFSCSNAARTRQSCWNEPVDGGATGKAVE